MATRRNRSNSSLSRKVGQKNPKKRVMVVCEGEKSEPNYLTLIHPKVKNSIIDLVLVDERATSPRELVDRACHELDVSTRTAKRTRDPNSRIDEIWCVFDVDEHLYLKESRQRAEDKGIKTAVSNPCLEVWLLMHFATPGGFLDRKEALRKLKDNMPGYEKNIVDIEPLIGKFDEAKKHAEFLEAKHLRDETPFPQDNPSSNIWELVDSLDARY
ncbi:RloB family protein [Rhodococcus sp. NBC_00297]|uniref:RloB family protein n=1 Tax=Rhodococcus sp. NBC_00297 TaxID=2976005 RepID=UPI002E2BEA55|nr:RloB family protein [Rhodococcus sp. NBC_00297]